MNELETSIEMDIPQIVADVLVSRGMSAYEMREFLYPDYGKHLHDPFLLLDMDKAVERIGLARERHERVAIYGDYDIDGITASAVMIETMTSLGIHAESYIPDRFEEGYGINLDALQTLKERKFDLVISDNPRVNRAGLSRADAPDFAFLQRSQKFDLHRRRSFADFVQKKRAAIRLFKKSFLSGFGIGERALFVSEKFGFE